MSLPDRSRSTTPTASVGQGLRGDGPTTSYSSSPVPYSQEEAYYHNLPPHALRQFHTGGAELTPSPLQGPPFAPIPQMGAFVDSPLTPNTAAQMVATPSDLSPVTNSLSLTPAMMAQMVATPSSLGQTTPISLTP